MPSAHPTSEGHQANRLSYAIVTTARNEEGYLADLVGSIAAQIARPVCWMIVDDGSSDRTPDVIRQARAEHDWIATLARPTGQAHSFGSKASAIAAGYRAISGKPFQALAVIDADTLFEPDYCASLLQRMAADPRVGIAGSLYTDDAGRTRRTRGLPNHTDVPGSCQVFRRECFEQIGGYRELELGGIDTLASIEARGHGWRTVVYPDLRYQHLGPMGRGKSAIRRGVMHGRRAYRLGGDPLWETARLLRHIVRKPYVVVGMAELFGYWMALIRRDQQYLPPDLVRFRRREQRRRVLAALRRMVSVRPTAGDATLERRG